MPVANKTSFGSKRSKPEKKLRLNYYIDKNLRTGLTGGLYYNIEDKGISINTSISMTYLTGK
ncbi:MAG: hypothetical protein OEV66_08055 [Spirochaetia bacterium]|nr:hypothetical protein [Spirochaetia bacterium]